MLATVPVANPTAMLARSDGLWYVKSTRMSLVHLDPSGRTVGHVTWPRADSYFGQYSGPVHLASGEGSMWVLFWSTGTLLRIDPATMAITGRTNLHGQGSGFEVEDLAVGLGHVWVTGCCNQPPSQRLYRIDPTTMNVDAQVALPGQGESQAVVAGPQGVFVRGERFDTVVQVDPSGTRILRQIPVPGGAGPVALGAEVWVLGGWYSGSSTGTTLSTIDPRPAHCTSSRPCRTRPRRSPLRSSRGLGGRCRQRGRVRPDLRPHRWDRPQGHRHGRRLPADGQRERPLVLPGRQAVGDRSVSAVHTGHR